MQIGLTGTSMENKMLVYSDNSLLDCEVSTWTSRYLIENFGDTISWNFYKQTNITRSSVYTKFLVFSLACSEIIRLDKVLRNINNRTFYPERYGVTTNLHFTVSGNL